MGFKEDPRLRDSRLLAPSGRGGEFTQLGAHLLADPCSTFARRRPPPHTCYTLLARFLILVLLLSLFRLMIFKAQLFSLPRPSIAKAIAVYGSSSTTHRPHTEFHSKISLRVRVSSTSRFSSWPPKRSTTDHCSQQSSKPWGKLYFGASLG